MIELADEVHLKMFLATCPGPVEVEFRRVFYIPQNTGKLWLEFTDLTNRTKQARIEITETSAAKALDQFGLLGNPKVCWRGSIRAQEYARNKIR